MHNSLTKIGQHSSVKVDLTGLNNLMSAAIGKQVVRVGVLGSKATEEHARKQEGKLKKSGGHGVGKDNSTMSNADIGLAHEKGIKSKNLPRRSWLQTPLEDRLPIYFNKLGQVMIYQMVLSNSIKAYRDLSIVCEQIILKGFENGGYGKWKALKSATIARKKSDTILVDTAQLKKSVTSEVVIK